MGKMMMRKGRVSECTILCFVTVMAIIEAFSNFLICFVISGFAILIIVDLLN